MLESLQSGFCDFVDWWTAERVTAAAGLVSVAVLAIAGVVANRHLKVSEALRRAEYRPYVVVRFSFARQMVSVEMVNLGRLGACDVTAEFSPSLRSDMRGGQARHALDAVSFLAPGESRRITLGAGPSLLNPPAENPWPLAYSVSVSYSSDQEDDENYTQTYVLDLRQLDQIAVETKPSGDKIAQELANVTGELTALRRSFPTSASPVDATSEEESPAERWARLGALRRWAKRVAGPRS